MTAPNIVGIPEYSPNFVDSIRVSFNILAAVIIVPALEAPGIRANIWNKPINKESNIDRE